jgi:hypothetical protein
MIELIPTHVIHPQKHPSQKVTFPFRRGWIAVQAKAAGFFQTGGVAALRRGFEKDENAGMDRKAPSPNGKLEAAHAGARAPYTAAGSFPFKYVVQPVPPEHGAGGFLDQAFHFQDLDAPC